MAKYSINSKESEKGIKARLDVAVEILKDSAPTVVSIILAATFRFLVL